MTKKKATKKAAKKKAPAKKYRIVLVCPKDEGGITTAENVTDKFKCPRCGAKLEVDDRFSGFKGDDHGHSLRQVTEV